MYYNGQNYTQQPMNGGYPQQQYGYTYGYPRPQARNTQPLTPDQIQKLRQDGSAFDMKVEQEDLWRAACTHKEKNGSSTLVQNQDGTWTCTICHETFNMCDASREEIEAAVNKLIDMLQTSKTVYLDAPDALIIQFYQIIPLLKKFPDLWDRAMRNFAQYEGTYGAPGMISPGYSGFAAMTSLLTNPYAAGAPFMGQMPAQPMPNGMPMSGQMPMYGYPQQPMAPNGMPMQQMYPDMSGNPMAYGGPAVPQPPMAPAPGVMPGNPQAAPVAAAPAQGQPQQGTEVQQQKTFNV